MIDLFWGCLYGGILFALVSLLGGRSLHRAGSSAGPLSWCGFLRLLCYTGRPEFPLGTISLFRKSYSYLPASFDIGFLALMFSFPMHP